MVVSFFGGERANVAYLIRNATAKVLRGDPSITEKLIASLDFKQRFCSGCMSFNEPINLGKIDQHINEFEDVISAGLPPGSLNTLWVRHTDKSRTELHFLIPQVNIITGRQFTIYLDNLDRRLVNALRDSINLREGYTRPDDPERKIMTSVPLRTTQAKKNLIQQVDTLIHTQVDAGKIKNRNDVVLFLECHGFEIKRGKKGQLPLEYLKIKKPEDEKFTSLRGAYYRGDFNAKLMVESQISVPSQEQELEVAIQRLKAETERRAFRQSQRHDMAVRAEERRQLKIQKITPLQPAIENLSTVQRANPILIPIQKQEIPYETERVTNPFSKCLGRVANFARKGGAWFGAESEKFGRLLEGLFKPTAFAAGRTSGLGNLSTAIDRCCDRLVGAIGRFDRAVGRFESGELSFSNAYQQTRKINNKVIHGPSIAGNI